MVSSLDGEFAAADVSEAGEANSLAVANEEVDAETGLVSVLVSAAGVGAVSVSSSSSNRRVRLLLMAINSLSSSSSWASPPRPPKGSMVLLLGLLWVRCDAMDVGTYMM